MESLGQILRRSAVVGAVAVALLIAAASADAVPVGLVSNYEAGSLSVLDTSTNRVSGEPIDLGGRPKSVAVTPDARFAYVVNEELLEVQAVELGTGRVVPIPIEGSSQLGEIAISPDGDTAYLADLSSQSLVSIDTRTNEPTGEAQLDAAASGIAVAPDGKTVYVAEQNAEEVQVVDARSDSVVGAPIELDARPTGISISPDGETVYVGDELAGLAEIDAATRTVRYAKAEVYGGPVTVSPDGGLAVLGEGSESIAVVDLATGALVRRIFVGLGPGEVALTADGQLAYVPDSAEGDIRVIDMRTFEEVGAPISFAGQGVGAITLTPDQSPSARFDPPSATVGAPTQFLGSASTDPDGSVASWSWAFGDGATAALSDPIHAYSAPGVYTVGLSVVDDEGCGRQTVFTGHTAYCSGNVGASVVRRVTVTSPAPSSPPAPPPPGPPPAPDMCRSVPRILGVAHRRGNGTARLAVRVPAAGSIFLFGKKIHAVTRRTIAADTLHLTLHARVEVNKRLKKEHRTGVRYRVTFYPAASCPVTTVHRSLALLRTPPKKR